MHIQSIYRISKNYMHSAGLNVISKQLILNTNPVSPQTENSNRNNKSLIMKDLQEMF